MYIEKISISKFRHLSDEELGPFKKPSKSSDLVVFAGPNGSGKSSVLELVGYALSNTYSLSWSLSRTFKDFSFEVSIGLTPEEISLVEENLEKELEPGLNELSRFEEEIEESQLEPLEKRRKIDAKREEIAKRHKNPEKVKDYLKENHVYFRAFNFPGGNYESDPHLHNLLHSYVTRILKEELQRSLGFFLRADRNYPPKNFERDKLFRYEVITKRTHLYTMAFNQSEIQYQDMYDFLVQQRYHYLQELGRFHYQAKRGGGAEEPTDPIIPYEELLKRLFPEYRFAELDESIPTNLFVKLPTGDVIPFNDLSSGEKEVFFILGFFIRHDVRNAIIIIDEPELHLHPELSRMLIRNLLSIRSGNQIWIATHNPEIIDEAGRHKLVYISRDLETRKAKIVKGDQEEQALRLLKDLFGFSGYVGVARKFVFLEGDHASMDRRFLSNLFPEESADIKFVPANSCNNLVKINAAILSIIETNLGWMEFFLIRDRDYLTDDIVSKYSDHKSNRIYVLERHEIENYLLDFGIIRDVLEDVFDKVYSEEELESFFFAAATRLSADVVRDMISYRLNLQLSPQDFSIGKVLAGNQYFEDRGGSISVIPEKRGIIEGKFVERVESVSSAVTKTLSQERLLSLIDECENLVLDSLKSSNWTKVFPGKELLESVAKELELGSVVAFHNSIIKEMGSRQDKPHLGDLGTIIKEIASGK